MNNLPETKADIQHIIDRLEAQKTGLRASHERQATECIRRAQELKDEDLEFNARMVLLHVMERSRKPDVYVSMFPWLLRKCDEDRQRFDYSKVMQAYRSVICYARQYASVSKRQLAELMKDVEQRMRELGSGDQIIHDDLFEFYRETGETELAMRELELFKQASTGYYSKCKKCATLIANCYLIDQGKYEELLEMIDPVLRGEITCHNREFYHFHMAMLAYMMLGQWDEAKKYDIKSRKKLDINTALLYPFSSHLVYYGITGQFAKGRTVFEKQFSLSTNEPDLPKLEFLCGALEFFKRLQSTGRKTIKLNIPKHEALPGNDSEYAVSKMLAYLDQEVNRIAHALDQRNENDYYRNFIRDLAARYGKVESPEPNVESPL